MYADVDFTKCIQLKYCTTPVSYQLGIGCRTPSYMVVIAKISFILLTCRHMLENNWLASNREHTSIVRAQTLQSYLQTYCIAGVPSRK